MAIQTKTIWGIKVKQRTDGESPSFFVFYSPAKAVAQWAGVEKTQDRSGAVQRVLRDSRLAGIRRFLSSDTRNTLPNNILIGFDPEKVNFTLVDCNESANFQNGCSNTIQYGKIEFDFDPDWPTSEMPAVVVDGQHRLFGASSFNGEDIPLLIVAMLDAKPDEQAFQFIVINNKAVKVPTITVKSIVADYEQMEKSLQDRLVPAGITYGKQSALLMAIGETSTSPFYNLLDWDRNRIGERMVAVTAIQTMISYLKSETQLIIENDEDSIQQIFVWVWRALQELYFDLWAEKNNQFFSKVNLAAMNEYCVDRIRSLASMQMLDLFSESAVTEAVKNTFGKIPRELWLKEWCGIQIQDNRVVRELLKNTFEKVAANCVRDRIWDQDLKLFAESNG
jgi:DGQHR domain-containing protein